MPGKFEMGCWWFSFKAFDLGRYDANQRWYYRITHVFRTTFFFYIYFYFKNCSKLTDTQFHSSSLRKRASTEDPSYWIDSSSNRRTLTYWRDEVSKAKYILLTEIKKYVKELVRGCGASLGSLRKFRHQVEFRIDKRVNFVRTSQSSQTTWSRNLNVTTEEVNIITLPYIIVISCHYFIWAHD